MKVPVKPQCCHLATSAAVAHEAACTGCHANRPRPGRDFRKVICVGLVCGPGNSPRASAMLKQRSCADSFRSEVKSSRAEMTRPLGGWPLCGGLGTGAALRSRAIAARRSYDGYFPLVQHSCIVLNNFSMKLDSGGGGGGRFGARFVAFLATCHVIAAQSRNLVIVCTPQVHN